jgi:hypothetical protein
MNHHFEVQLSCSAHQDRNNASGICRKGKKQDHEEKLETWAGQEERVTYEMCSGEPLPSPILSGLATTERNR